MSLAAAEYHQPVDVEPALFYVTTPATDRRLILPSELVIEMSITLAQAQDLADRVSQQIAAILCREPWRETVTEQRHGSDCSLLPLSRWPIEGEAPTGTLPEDPPGVTVVDGSVVDLTAYNVTGEERGSLYRFGKWAASQNFEIDYTGGYLMPGQLGRINTAADPDRHITTWEASTAYVAGASHAYGAAVGGWVLPTTPNGRVFRCSTSGTSGGSEPTWDKDIGATTADGTVIWTAHGDYILLPEMARQAVLMLARKLRAFDRNAECPADCADAEAMARRAFGGGC